jgi:hypothetical protein
MRIEVYANFSAPQYCSSTHRESTHGHEKSTVSSYRIGMCALRGSVAFDL